MFSKPTLLLDEKKCRENINRMCAKAQKNDLVFRPHFKTHQSLEIGRWYKELGVNRITVSSLEMAVYFSTEWDDITVAFPVNILEIDTINALAQKINLNLILESTETISFLQENLKSHINFFIKIDVGYHRTGIMPSNTALIEDILKIADTTDLLTFKGFLGHAGHTYHCRSKPDIIAIHDNSREIMVGLKDKFKTKYPDLIISLGDTPSCSLAEDFSGIDEIRPGNFVFYDLTQNQISSNSIAQIAVAMKCPIVAIHKDRNEVIIYGGGVHFAKDQLKTTADGIIYGRIVHENQDGSWGDIIADMFIKSLSQEHGIVSVPNAEIDKLKVGGHLIVLPVHSCMAANSMKSYTITGQNKTVSRL